MAISDAVLALYADLKTSGRLEGIDSVAELGSQTVWSQHPERLRALFAAFGRPLPPPAAFSTFISSGGRGAASSRSLHGYLGFKRYDCIDIDENCGALPLDLNFDAIPDAYRGQYGLITNIGTSEHILNQSNTFKAIHDLTAPGGLMLHVSPYIGWPEHGFFNYQPNFFQAIARYNSYEVLGMWRNHDPRPELVSLLDAGLALDCDIQLGANYNLVTLLRKTRGDEFFMPIQGHYELELPAPSRARYRPL